MRQKIVHGATIDVATPAEVDMAIARAFSFETVDEFQRYKGSITLSAGGAGQTTLPVIPAGYDWRIERVSIFNLGTTPGIASFYENTVSGQDFLEQCIANTTSGNYSDSFDNTLYVQGLSQLVIAVVSGPASGIVDFNLQIMVKKRPRRMRGTEVKDVRH